MKSVRLNDAPEGEPLSWGRIDEILSRGKLEDFTNVISIIQAKPNGTEANVVVELYQKRDFNDEEFYNKEMYLAAYYLVMSMRKFAPYCFEIKSN